MTTPQDLDVPLTVLDAFDDLADTAPGELATAHVQVPEDGDDSHALALRQLSTGVLLDLRADALSALLRLAHVDHRAQGLGVGLG